MDEGLRQKIKQQHRLGYPWASAGLWGIYFTETDINYIKTVIMTDKKYHAVVQNSESRRNREKNEKYDNIYQEFYNIRLRSYTNEIEFFERFYNDENCPECVRQFLYFHIGNLRTGIDSYGFTKDLVRLSFFTELWFRTVCVHKPKKKRLNTSKKKNVKRKKQNRMIVSGKVNSKFRPDKNSDSIPTVYMVNFKRTHLIKGR